MRQAKTFANSVVHRLRQLRGDMTNEHKSTISSSNRRQMNRRQDNSRYAVVKNANTTALDVAKFGILSIVTLPFTVWIAQFTNDYVNRVQLCRKRLEQWSEEHKFLVSESQQGKYFGREKQLKEESRAFEKEPNQIVVIAGSNEVGKSRFIVELLRRQKYAKLVQLTHLVDSVSSITQIIVDRFGLRWLAMRHMLVDVLPFAGSEILVMKERFSDRDLEQALVVIEQALKEHAASTPSSEPKPVICFDGLGEGDSEFTRSRENDLCMQRLLQWCVYVTKERRLAHIILTGNEQLVLSLSEHNRKTRGHIKVVGLGELQLHDAAKFVKQEIPDATSNEVQKLTGIFGGFVHDLRWATSEFNNRLKREESKPRSRVLDEVIKGKLQLQVERVMTAFSRGAETNEPEGADNDDSNDDEENDEEEMDPYLDPLKSIYSEKANDQRKRGPSNKSPTGAASWTKLQLWQTLQRLVDSEQLSVPLAELRDDIFDGDSTPILDLMEEDVLGFKASSTSDGTMWNVMPATPALGRAFEQLLNYGGLKNRFDVLEQEEKIRSEIKEAEQERRSIYVESKKRQFRKASLLRTVDLGGKLGREERARKELASVYDLIVKEEVLYEEEDRRLRRKIDSLRQRQALQIEISPLDGNQAMEEAKSLKAKLSSPTLKESMNQTLKTALPRILANQDPPLTMSLKNADLSELKAAFQNLDSAKRGALTPGDVAKGIEAVTGEKVDIEVAQSLVRAYDVNHNGLLEYEEFLNMLGLQQRSQK